MFNIWHALDEKNWKRHDSPLRSAELLLEELYDDPEIRYKPQRIPLSSDIDGFQALAWALPPMLAKWGGRIRELALDSACECFLFYSVISPDPHL